MPRFTFIAEHLELDGSPTGDIVTHEFTEELLTEVLERFELFLRGCGYTLDGILDIISDEPIIEEHSEHYYEFDRNKPIKRWDNEEYCND